MKKKLIIGALSVAVVFGSAFAVGAVNNDGKNKVDQKANVTSELLSIDDVKKIALQEVDGVIEEIELERESGRAIYEVEVEKNGVDYDLYIDAQTGEIYSVDHDDDDVYSKRGQNNSGIISVTEAVVIAEKAVNGKVIEIEKDEDDGYFKYEVELKTDRGEAEVEIDATTGKVLDVEWDD